MVGHSWIALLKRIPVKVHDTLMLSLVNGDEVVLQSIFRLEGDFMIVRGRLSGTTDAGRVIVIPYDQVINLAFTRRMAEPEVRAIFGEGISESAFQDVDVPAYTEPALEEAPPEEEVEEVEERPVVPLKSGGKTAAA